LVSSTVFIALSLLVNIILAALIASRLIYRRRRFQRFGNILGKEHGSPYINIITMCVESSALIVIFNGIYTVLALTLRQPDVYGALIPFLLLPHIFVGGLKHYGIWCTCNTFGITRLSRPSSSFIVLPWVAL
jgi:hypothetical protein